MTTVYILIVIVTFLGGVGDHSALMIDNIASHQACVAVKRQVDVLPNTVSTCVAVQRLRP